MKNFKFFLLLTSLCLLAFYGCDLSDSPEPAPSDTTMNDLGEPTAPSGSLGITDRVSTCDVSLAVTSLTGTEMYICGVTHMVGLSACTQNNICPNGPSSPRGITIGPGIYISDFYVFCGVPFEITNNDTSLSVTIQLTSGNVLSNITIPPGQTRGFIADCNGCSLSMC